VVLKCHFDGGNQADSTQYKTVTLGSLFGRKDEWTPFENQWKNILNTYGADYLHTSDAVTLNGIYKGWRPPKRDAFIQECADLIKESIVKPDGDDSVTPGLFPCAIVIVLEDFNRARGERLFQWQNANEVLAVQSFYRAIECLQVIEGHFLQMYFDQNEPFMGHFKDRRNNAKFVADIKKQGFDIERRIAHIGESDMRLSPALQAADLLAYCVGRKHEEIKFTWQRTMLETDRIEEWLDYSVLVKPIPGVFDLVTKRWKFPKRGATK